MGDRAQVKIVDYGDTAVYLYTHWDGYRLADTVKQALARRERWRDAEYLARIVFCEMVKGDTFGTTGFGIGTEQHMDVTKVITLDTNKCEITLQDYDKDDIKFSFEDFINE